MITNIDRRFAFYSLALAGFFILTIRLFYLQIYSRERFYRKAEENRIRAVSLEPLRGVIFDRKGVPLVDNEPAYSVFAIPFEIRKSKETVPLLSRFLNLDKDYLLRKLQNPCWGPWMPVRLRRQVDFMGLSALEEHKLDLPGVILRIEPTRCYPSPVKAPHLFGYLGEITVEELKNLKRKGYRIGDIVGKKGIEKEYDLLLRGERGIRYVEVDALGRELRVLKEKKEIPPRPGANLYLTIDADLQAFIEQKFEGMKGSVVVLDPSSGEVLAMVSKPDYDPELFAGVITPELWDKLQHDPGHPLYDRTIQSTYPPGSTFKLVLALAAVETGKVTKDWTVHCPGYFKLGGRYFDCWKKRGHRKVNLLTAIEQSCNVYFYQLGLRVGLDDWAKFAKALGFGSKTGIDLPGESKGLVPDREYLDQKYGTGKWPQGLIPNLAVGQGELLVTPLQMACLAGIIANNGRLYRPHLLRFIEDPLTGEKRGVRVSPERIRGISEEAFEVIKEGMLRVVNGRNGTGRAARIPGIKVAGKTGTAQNPHGADHAWFIGFAPYSSPRIALSILVENGGMGGRVAAPLARLIFQKFLSKQCD